MSQWEITFVDGSVELTPDTADKLRVGVNGDLLSAVATRTYGPDETKKTYVLANVRSWEPVR